MEFVTLWSKSCFAGVTLWVIERTHTADFMAYLVGIRSFDEIVTIGDRYYRICRPGVDPNSI